MNMESSDGTRKQAIANKQNDKKSLSAVVRAPKQMTRMEKTHLIKMISTAWRKSSQVLYSSGSSCNGAMSGCGERAGHGTAAHVEGIVFSHLTHELFTDPGSHLRPTVLIEPP